MLKRFSRSEVEELFSHQHLTVNEYSEYLITCDLCGVSFFPGEVDGVPNGFGMLMEDGTVYAICRECAEAMLEEEQNAFD